MTQPDSAPTRSLPDRPSFRQLRKQAKELLKSYRAGEPDAAAEVGQFEADPDPATFALVDAQRVLARAYGFSSWTKLKQHVDGPDVKDFCEAVDAGDVATVRKLVKVRPELVNIARGGSFGERIALHFAVLNRDAEMTRVLMELGSDARRGFWPYRDATTAFTIASDREYHEVVAIIQQEEDRQRKQRSLPNATISSKTDEIAKAILEDRCDEAIRILESDLSLVGACTNHGATPLHLAAWKHNPEMVGWLLDRQALVDAENPVDGRAFNYSATADLGKTPLDYAAIVAGWSANEKYFGWSANDDRFPYLENARRDPARFQETVDLLLSNGAELTPRAAVAIGDQQAVLRLHREDRLHNEINMCRGGLLAIAVRVNRIDMVTLLLDLGLDPDEPATPADDGTTSWGFPLWFAAMCGRYEIAELLLARRADVNAIVCASGDPLCQAYATRDEKMKALLLKHGARLTVENLADGDRETAKAILEGRVPAQSLNVADPTPTQLAEQLLWASAGSDPEIVRMCLPHVRRKPNDPWWAYVLMHARLRESLQLVLDHGIDPDVGKKGDPTPLHHIATDYVNATGHVSEEQRRAFATMLLDAGASFNRRESLLQSTPLGWACRWGRVELVKLYLKRGADAVEMDAEPWATPLAWATKGGNHDIIQLLVARGAK